MIIYKNVLTIRADDEELVVQKILGEPQEVDSFSSSHQRKCPGHLLHILTKQEVGRSSTSGHKCTASRQHHLKRGAFFLSSSHTYPLFLQNDFDLLSMYGELSALPCKQFR